MYIVYTIIRLKFYPQEVSFKSTLVSQVDQSMFLRLQNVTNLIQKNDTSKHVKFNISKIKK